MKIETIKHIFLKIADVTIPAVAGFRRELELLSVATKDDSTLLTEADITVQRAIVETIRESDPDGWLIAEETLDSYQGKLGNELTWVIDPIDGTKEFIDSASIEFCTAVCALHSNRSVASLIIAHELGPNRNPLVIEAYQGERKALLNGDGIAIRSPSALDLPHYLSLTRSGNSEVPPYETEIKKLGCLVKTRTTSQTLDLARVSLDLTAYAPGVDQSFDLFFRKKQKLWDGLPGIFIAALGGWSAMDIKGRSLMPLAASLLGANTPSFTTTLVSSRDHCEWFRRLTGVTRG